ncbi:MAG TPA: hypothetical protein DCZ97_01465 [Syntrophus sp. (in: bacteria)]|nr:hypothetical protein [Syntrophus sp. (in: bacteria)]
MAKKRRGGMFPEGDRSGSDRMAASLLQGSLILLVCVMFLIAVPVFAAEETLKLPDLIREALKNNPEIHVAEARANASTHKIPQAMSLADPMFMMGYENEGTDSPYTFGRETKGMPADSRWMFSLSQMFPYPGKLALKGEMATYDAESLKAMTAATKLATEVRVKELFYDLQLAYTNIDLLTDQAALFSRVEDAALARYASGMAPQQEVLMAQTEKYMLLEREEMEKQKIQSLKAMLNAALGRDALSPLGRPEKPQDTVNNYRLDELIKMSHSRYPMIKSREKMASAAEAKIAMAKKEYYPDITIGAGYFARSSQFPDMWNVTATINIPIFYRTKQREAVLEAEASLLEARRNVEATKLMTSSALRDNHAMLKSAENLMALYREGLIPKAYQGFELALAGYVTGKVEAITAITRLKALIEYEFLYWKQYTDGQKAAARLDGLAVITDYGADVNGKRVLQTSAVTGDGEKPAPLSAAPPTEEKTVKRTPPEATAGQGKGRFEIHATSFVSGTPPEATADQGKERFEIHTASFREKRQAEQVMKKIEPFGFSPRIEMDDPPGKGRRFRVSAGGFETRETAQEAADQIAGKIRGLKYWIRASAKNGSQAAAGDRLTMVQAGATGVDRGRR